jgi:membrane fusion protein, multidrug efflux system
MIEPNYPPTEESNTQEEELQIVPTSKETGKKSLSRWWIVVGFLGLAFITGWGAKFWLTSNKDNPQMGAMGGQPQGLPVKLETLNSELLEDTTTVVGVLDAPRGVTVKSEVRGKVNRIFVRDGARVQSGQVILTLESDELEGELFQAKAQLENAQARLAQAKAGNRPEDIAEGKAQLDQAIARLNNAKQGALPEEIAQGVAQVESAQAELDLAQERVKRYSNLEEEGAISQDRYDEIVKTERLASAALTEAQRRLDGLSKGRQSDLKELEAAVEQARQNLKRLESGTRIEEIAQAEAAVAQAKAGMNMVEVKIRKPRLSHPLPELLAIYPLN